MPNFVEWKYWWFALQLWEQLAVLVVFCTEVYLIIIRKNPVSFLIGALLLLATVAYFTNFWGVSPGTTRGTMHMQWTK